MQSLIFREFVQNIEPDFSTSGELLLHECLVELPLVQDWPVLVLDDAPVKVFGNVVVLWSIIFLVYFVTATDNVGYVFILFQI